MPDQYKKTYGQNKSSKPNTSGQPQKTPIPMKQIIEKDDPVILVKEAKKLAKDLNVSDEATKTQVRRLFGSIRQIEMNWPVKPKDAYRELVLFGPRLAYQAKRHKAIAPLAREIQNAIPLVGEDREKLHRLVQFFEATVAYYISNEDSKREGYHG